MYVSISTDHTIRITEIIAIVSKETYTPTAFMRLLVPIDKVKSFVVTDDFIYGTPLKAQAILKKINEQRV